MDSLGSVPQNAQREKLAVVNYCARCGTKVAEDGNYCSNCGRDVISKESTASTGIVVTPTTPALPKRPTGVAIICVLWFFGGLYNLFAGLTALGDDLEAMAMLNNPIYRFPSTVRSWVSWAIPLETTLVIFTIVIGLLQLATIYGLWKRKNWSYKCGISLLVGGITVVWAGTFLTMTAPKALNLQPNFTAPIFTTVFAVIYLAYLRQDHVKKYLRVL